MAAWFKKTKTKEEEKGITPGDSAPPEEEKKVGIKEAAKGVLYGMASHGNVTSALRTRMYMEHLFKIGRAHV